MPEESEGYLFCNFQKKKRIIYQSYCLRYLMIELPFRISLGVMLPIKNKTCASTLQRRKQPHGEGHGFPRTAATRSIPPSSQGTALPASVHLKCPHTVSGGLYPHESDPPLRERRRRERPLLTQAPNSAGSGVRAQQAALVLRGCQNQPRGQLSMGKQRRRANL